MSELNCFVCKKDLGTMSVNIFTSSSLYSDTILYKFFEIFLNLNTDDLLRLYADEQQNCQICPNCNAKVNQYDQGVTMADKAQYELTKLLRTKIQVIEENDGTEMQEVHQFEEDEELEDIDEKKAVKEQKYFEKTEVNEELTVQPVVAGHEESIYEDESMVEEQFTMDEQTTTTEQIVHEEQVLYEIEEVELDNQKQEMISHDEDTKPTKLDPIKGSPKIIKRKSKQRRKYKKKTKEGYICDLCGVNFKTAEDFQEHQNQHKGLENFQCPSCYKIFTQKGALVRHMPMHTGETPFVCECGKKFTHYSSYHMHRLIHDGVRDKSCQECGKTFRSTSHLKRHQRTHSGEKPYECPLCLQKFAQRYNMTSHYKAHKGIHRKKVKKTSIVIETAEDWVQLDPSE